MKHYFVISIFVLTISCSKKDHTGYENDPAQKKYEQLTNESKNSSVFSPQLITFFNSLKDVPSEKHESALKNFLAANPQQQKVDKPVARHHSSNTTVNNNTLDDMQLIEIAYHSPDDARVILGILQYNIITGKYEKTADWEMAYNPFGFWELWSSELLIATYNSATTPRYNVTEATHYGSYLQGLTANVINYSENSQYFTVSSGVGVISVVHGTLSTILYTRPVHVGLMMLNAHTFPG